MLRRVPLAVLAFACAISPSSLHAQETLAKLADKFEDVTLYGMKHRMLSNNIQARTGYGFEFSFDLARRYDDPDTTTLNARCMKKRAKDKEIQCIGGGVALRNTIESITSNAGANPARPIMKPDTSRGDTERKADTTFTVTKVDLRDELWLFELAVGNQTTPIRSKDFVVTNWNLSGTLKEWPAFSLYATRQQSPIWFVPYFGLTMTLAELADLRVAQPQDTSGATAASVKGVAGGASIGFVTDIQEFNFFVQGEYTNLWFGPDWKLPQNFPAGQTLPTRIDASGFRLSFGVQLDLGGPDKDKK